MNRDTLLAKKAAEMTHQLQCWSDGILLPGESLIVSLVICAVEQDQSNSILEMKLFDFFTVERFHAASGEGRFAVRTRNCLENHRWWIKSELENENPTLGEYLERFTASTVLRTPNLGRRCLSLIQQTLEASGLSLDDPSGILKKS